MDLKVLIVVAFLMCSGSELHYRQKDQSKRKHNHLLSCTYRLGLWGGGCRHWNKEIEKESTDVEGQRDKLGWRR